MSSPACNDKQPGIDNIDNKLIRIAIVYVTHPVCHILNTSTSNTSTSTSQCQALIMRFISHKLIGPSLSDYHNYIMI